MNIHEYTKNVVERAVDGTDPEEDISSHEVLGALLGGVFDRIKEEFDTDDPTLGLPEMTTVGSPPHPAIVAQLMMEMIVHSDAMTTEAKAAALVFAEYMGPDWAQALYRFAVLTTKLT